MANTIVTGVVGTHTTGQLAANVKPDIDQVLKVLEPYQKPFSSFLMLSKKKSKPVYSQYAKFDWFEKVFYPHYAAVATAATLTSTTIVLTAAICPDKAIFGLQDIVLLEETAEMAYVSSVTAGGGSDVVLTHMDGSTTLTALTVGLGFNIRIIGTRTFEFGGRIDAKTVQEVNQYNYLNEFKRYVTTSGRQEAGMNYTDGLTHDERVEQKVKELQLEIERYFFFANARGYATSGNERTTWGYGLDGVLSTNVKTYSGKLTEDAFRAYLKSVMALGSGKKIHFAGSNQMEDIEAFMLPYYQLQQTPKELSVFEEFGGTIKTFRLFSGTVSLVWNPVLDLAAADSGYTVDEANVSLRHMAPDKKGSRKFRIRTNTQDPDQNGTETEILFDCGLQVELESTHGKLSKV
jgi:hypothetical protein